MRNYPFQDPNVALPAGDHSSHQRGHYQPPYANANASMTYSPHAGPSQFTPTHQPQQYQPYGSLAGPYVHGPPHQYADNVPPQAQYRPSRATRSVSHQPIHRTSEKLSTSSDASHVPPVHSADQSAPATMLTGEITLAPFPRAIKQRLIRLLPETIIPRLDALCKSRSPTSTDQDFWRSMYLETFGNANTSSTSSTSGPPKKKARTIGTQSQATAGSGSEPHNWQKKYLKDVKRLCEGGCGTPTDNLCPLSKDHICHNCRRNHPDYKTMTKTLAKKQYRLTDNDLQPLPHHTKPNPKYRRAAPMREYLIKHLKEASYAKHGGADGLATRNEAVEKASEKRQNTLKSSQPAGEGTSKEQTRSQQKETRRIELINALAAYNLPIPTHSKPCHTYINTGKGSLPTLVHQIHSHHILYKHSPYEELAEASAEYCMKESLYNDNAWDEYEKHTREIAMRILEWAEEKYRAGGGRNGAEVCGCGRVLIPDLVEEGVEGYLYLWMWNRNVYEEYRETSEQKAMELLGRPDGKCKREGFGVGLGSELILEMYEEEE
ncbi:hypothetical protein HDV00_010976 [Rhizophlyctis rosea]|nr:hypothetical protein HDV00_010976 [Rhizophlyctis rosea]